MPARQPAGRRRYCTGGSPVPRIDEPLAMTQGGVTSYYQADGLGSITSVRDSGGGLVASYTYDTFGNLTASTGTLTNPFRYTGREFDAETGLYYYRARYYDPTTGRFLGEDPARFAGDRANFYRYAGNSPTNYADPMGLWSPEAHDALIRHALQNCGVPESQIERLQQLSRDWDSLTGTDPRFSNYHSMLQPAQSIEGGITARNNIVADELNHAQADWAGHHTDLALYDMAIAIHALMDMTSPAHVVNGEPIMWCGVLGCNKKQDPSGRSEGNVSEHSPIEGVGIEDKQHITREIYGSNDDMIRFAYGYMTGKPLNCRCRR